MTLVVSWKTRLNCSDICLSPISFCGFDRHIVNVENKCVENWLQLAGVYITIASYYKPHKHIGLQIF